MTLAEAREAIRFCDSYSLLPTILDLYKHGISKTETLTLLGEWWPSCDNIWEHAEELDDLLPSGPAPEMMTEDERAAFDALPKRVTIYRGCDRGVNERGLCWSRDRKLASRFPFFYRFRAANPVLVTATVSRSRIVAVKLDRTEFEIIVKWFWLRVLSVRPLKDDSIQMKP